MMRTVQIILNVKVDTTDDWICPSGDHLKENCILNAIDDDFFLDDVQVLNVQEVQE